MSVATRAGVTLLAWAVALLAAGAPQQPQPPLPLSALPLRLTGLALDENTPAKSACLVRCAGPPEIRGLFFAGQRICDLAEVREIRPDGVVIENLVTKRAEFLTFSDTKPPAGAPPPASSPAQASAPSPEVVSIQRPRESLAHYLANLPELLDSAVATPRYQDLPNGQRSIDGYEIGSIKAGSVVEQLGLQNGDVILEVNGQTLDGPATVVRLFGELQAAPQATVTVVRNGQKMTFVFNTK